MRVLEESYLKEIQYIERLEDTVQVLVEALEGLLRMVVDGECSYDAQGNDWPEVAQAKAAIARAKGE